MAIAQTELEPAKKLRVVKSAPWLPGATTVLRVQDAVYGSEALVNWAAKIAAEEALRGVLSDNLDWDAAYNRAIGAITTARDRGSAVHYGVELAIRDEPHIPGPETHAYWYGWSRFLLKERPEIVATERKVINPTVGYGTTMDLVCRLPLRGEGLVQIDVKSGSVKDSHVLQLAAGAMAERWDDGGGVARNKWHQYQLTDGPTIDPMPLEEHYVLHLDPSLPQGYELIPMAVGPDEIEHFAFLARTFGRLKAWKKGAAA